MTQNESSQNRVNKSRLCSWELNYSSSYTLSKTQTSQATLSSPQKKKLAATKNNMHIFRKLKKGKKGKHNNATKLPMKLLWFIIFFVLFVRLQHSSQIPTNKQLIKTIYQLVAAESFSRLLLCLFLHIQWSPTEKVKSGRTLTNWPNLFT